MTMADIDPAAIAAANNRLELAKLVKAYATSTEPQALAITCVTCRREHDIGENCRRPDVG